MGTTPKASSDKRSPELPTEQDLVAFDHVAAGHEGISSNASGSLVIKPCTAAEIAFYESAKEHEHFMAHMPTFMGTLALDNDVSSSSIAPLLAHTRDVVSVHAPKRNSTYTLPHISELSGPISRSSSSHHLSSDSIITPISSKRASWKPSGGKKLETGLAIVLENITAGFKHPNILDVKLGARLWADDAPASKRKKLDDVSKATTSGSLGFRIAGMKLWNGGDDITTQRVDIEIKDGHKFYDKHYGQSLTSSNVQNGFADYFGGIKSDESGKPQLKRILAKTVAERILRELESVQYVLEHEESRMYSASILMVYEGDDEALQAALRDEEMTATAGAENAARSVGEPELPNDEHGGDEDTDDEEEDLPKVHDLRLIDFAHASWTPGQGPDENALQGVRSVIRIIRGLVR